MLLAKCKYPCEPFFENRGYGRQHGSPCHVCAVKPGLIRFTAVPPSVTRARRQRARRHHLFDHAGCAFVDLTDIQLGPCQGRRRPLAAFHAAEDRPKWPFLGSSLRLQRSDSMYVDFPLAAGWTTAHGSARYGFPYLDPHRLIFDDASEGSGSSK